MSPTHVPDPRARLFFWIGNITSPVAEGGPANDEMLSVRASELYNLLHAARDYEDSAERKYVLRLEQRIHQQRGTITVLQGKLRERNVARAEWYRGRDMLLREMLRDVTASMNSWKAQALDRAERLAERKPK
jgi:hypothetical protein